MVTFILFALSLKVYEFQSCIIPHFKALEKSFWNVKFNFGSRIKDFRAIKQQMFLIFWVQTLLTYISCPNSSYLNTFLMMAKWHRFFFSAYWRNVPLKNPGTLALKIKYIRWAHALWWNNTLRPFLANSVSKLGSQFCP